MICRSSEVMIWQGRNGEKVLKLRVIGRLGYAARHQSVSESDWEAESKFDTKLMAKLKSHSGSE